MKTLVNFLVLTAALLWASSSDAAEKWLAVTWDDTVAAEFGAMCTERGLTSRDVLEANNCFGTELPSKGEVILLPVSKNDLLSTWLEAQKRNGGPKPLVTVKLHGVPIQKIQAEAAMLPKAADSARSQALVEPVNVPEQKIALLPVVPLPATPAKPQTTFGGKMMWPVDGKVSSGFGKRGKRSFHTGLDIPMPKGTPIVAALDGVVAETATSKDRRYRGYGNIVLLDHGNGLMTMYAHCSEVKVKKGQFVTQGEVVALVGNTGRTTTHHVHFEVKDNGKKMDPFPYLASR